jgi:anhydro-N-acetylmuramic acid kinase
MVIDACMERLFQKPFDRNGTVARRGAVVHQVADEILREPYFSAQPPKSCGREQFGERFVSRFIKLCRKARAKDEDIIATATALTADTILHAYRSFVWAHLGQVSPLASIEMIVAGGGVKNRTLMEMLQTRLSPLSVKLRPLEEFGLPSQAKEGVAFALLGWLAWHRLPGNIPAATGAERPVILGKVTFR